MCGIAGLFSLKAAVTPQIILGMTERMRLRGPDSSGLWITSDQRLGLGHRRLAILDVSEAGHQPMHSSCGRLTLVYNGEIYNFAEIRRALEVEDAAPAWRGHSDTEVLLAAIAHWGLVPALERCSGMFALALWDEARRELTLARDRFGEKPLYYGWCAAGFAFASTLAPIQGLPGFANPLEPQALAALMARAYIPAPWSIWRGIRKLEPGCFLTFRPDDGHGRAGTFPEPQCWYDYGAQVRAGADVPLGDREEACKALQDVLGTAIRRQLVADVPVGLFLSGGIDSSIVAALAQQASAVPVRSFTIGFDEEGFDEAGFARQVAGHLGTQHHELYVSARDARDVIPELPAMYDEPFADSSQIPTHLVARLARQQVTVALSGDGGDEMFGGYNRHQQIPRLWRRVRNWPAFLRRGAFEAAGGLPPALWNGLGRMAGRRRSREFGQNARRAFIHMARADDFDDLFDRFLDDWALHPSPLRDSSPRQARLALDARLGELPLEVAMMQADSVTYLPGDILTKVDRAAMAVSLETRVPFLDPAVVALAARITPSLKFRDGAGKHILKELLYAHVPRALVDRPKAGFALPLGAWLRGPLRDWAETLLSPQALEQGGVFVTDVVRARWADHLAGREEATQALWSVLMFQAWRGHNGL